MVRGEQPGSRQERPVSMRFKGTLATWQADRGVGTVLADQGGAALAVHVSAFPRDGRVPSVGEVLSFEVDIDRNAQKCAVRINRVLDPQPPPLAFQKRPARHSRPLEPRRPSATGRQFGFKATALLISAVIALGVYGYERYAPPQAAVQAVLPPAQSVQTTPTSLSSPGFSCDGRKHCSQMTSCSEAKLFLKNCPGTEMDGDGDGVPCEQQWCVGG